VKKLTMIQFDKPRRDDVDRAIAGVRTAMTKLANKMQTDDGDARGRAAWALMQMGPYAAGPVAVVLSRTPAPAHRLYMLGLLRSIGSAKDPDVVRVLFNLAKKDPHKVVGAVAAEIFSQFMDENLVAETEAARRGTSGERGRAGRAGRRPADDIEREKDGSGA
jgi:hypothetical protein